MTKRGVIISSSIIAGLMLLVTILFGCVFRVRNIDVKYADDFKYSSQISEIVTSSKIKKGNGIFSIDKDKAVSNIEQQFPYARVDGISITSVTNVKISVSNRSPFYYIEEQGTFYVLDEDCKVLNISTDSEIPSKYINLNSVFNVGQDVKEGDFLKNKYTSACSQLYKSLYSYAVLNIGDLNEQGGRDEKYLDRNDMTKIISAVRFNEVEELNGKVDRLIIYTRTDVDINEEKVHYGVKIEISDPNNNLNNKINMAFSALRKLQSEDILNSTDKITKGSICVRFSYDELNNVILKCEYRA